MSEPLPTRSWRCGPGVFQKALDELRRQGGTTAGGHGEGTFSAATPLGLLEGRYAFDGEELTIEVTSRPAMLPIAIVWTRLDALCGPPVARA